MSARGAAVAIGLLAGLAIAWVVAYGGEYTIVFKNESGQSGVAMVYQLPPDTSMSNVFAVAWQTTNVSADPTRDTTFSWSEEYSVSWSQSGGISTGAIYSYATSIDVDLSEGAGATLDLGSGSLEPSGQGGGIQPGALQVSVSGGNSGQIATVGVGIDGTTGLVVSIPTGAEWTYEPTSTYYIAFGHFIEGMVLNVALIANAVAIDFSDGTSTFVVTYGKDHQFTVTSGDA